MARVACEFHYIFGCLWNCALCGKAIDKIDWRDHKPGVLGPDRKTALWSDFRPELLPQIMATHQTICWDCHSGR